MNENIENDLPVNEDVSAGSTGLIDDPDSNAVNVAQEETTNENSRNKTNTHNTNGKRKNNKHKQHTENT